MIDCFFEHITNNNYFNNYIYAAVGVGSTKACNRTQ